MGNRLMELEDKEVTACLDSCTITVDMVLNKLRLFFFFKDIEMPSMDHFLSSNKRYSIPQNC